MCGRDLSRGGAGGSMVARGFGGWMPDVRCERVGIPCQVDGVFRRPFEWMNGQS